MLSACQTRIEAKNKKFARQTSYFFYFILMKILKCLLSFKMFAFFLKVVKYVFSTI